MTVFYLHSFMIPFHLPWFNIIHISVTAWRFYNASCDAVTTQQARTVVYESPVANTHKWRCGVVGSTLAFGSIGHGFESELRLFSHHRASDFSKLRSLAECSLDDSVRRLL